MEGICKDVNVWVISDMKRHEEGSCWTFFFVGECKTYKNIQSGDEKFQA